MTDSVLIRETDGPVVTLTMNRPEALNALSEALLAELQQGIDALASDRSVRVVILRGAGRAFCAGHDLREMTAGRRATDGGKEYFDRLFTTCARMMMSLTRLPQIVIAEVQGIATAAGCQLVAHCDLAVAAESARFGVNGVNIGLFCSTPMVALTRNIGRKAAMEMLTTGDLIPAGRARGLGLLNSVVDDDALATETRALAHRIAAKPARVLAIGKEAFYAQTEMGVAEAYAYAGGVMTANMMLAETEEGIDAFLCKRPPDWSG